MKGRHAERDEYIMTINAKTTRHDIVFISWAPYCSRSDGIAARLGGVSYMVYSAFWGSRYATILFKYAGQFFRTLGILIRRRPKAVFVMTPPVTACFGVWLYCKLSRAVYFIDAHTGAFLDDRWQRTMFLHRFFSRGARSTIVTNARLQELVQGWGAHATIVRDVPVQFAEPADMPDRNGCRMTLVSSFADDEPIDVFFEAAEKVPDVTFHVTGDPKGAPAELLQKKPDNVELTGFLPDPQYVGLLKSSDAVIALTNRDHTMQRGGYEAVYLEKPVVISNFGLLREAFHVGAVHVDNSAADIARGIRQMQNELPRLSQEVKQLRLLKLAQWVTAKNELLALIQNSPRDVKPSEGNIA